jgi:hypothetical protein
MNECFLSTKVAPSWSAHSCNEHLRSPFHHETVKWSKREHRTLTQGRGGTYVLADQAEGDRLPWMALCGSACTLFRRHALNVRTYSEIEVVQNDVYLVTFLAKHQVV